MLLQQTALLTGRSYLGDYTRLDQEYQALMDAGVTYAKQWNLRPGIALTATQIAQLTSDLIWLVNENITLPDGSVQTVLTPRLYVVTQPGDLTPSGALISGNNVIFDTDGKVSNSGTIAARNLVQVTAGDIDNLGGRIQGTQVALGATRDINVMGGSIQAAQTLLMHADNNVNIASVVGPYGGNISQIDSVGVTGNKANPDAPSAECWPSRRARTSRSMPSRSTTRPAMPKPSSRPELRAAPPPDGSQSLFHPD